MNFRYPLVSDFKTSNLLILPLFGNIRKTVSLSWVVGLFGV